MSEWYLVGKIRLMFVLETERMLFRPHQEEDLEASCALDADPDFRRPFEPLNRVEAEHSFRIAWLPEKPLGMLATIYKPEDQYIGRCGLYPHRNEENEIVPGEATLAFYLSPVYWGRGLATEAGRAFVEYGFTNLGLSRIVAGASVKNLASNRVIQKVGLTWLESGGDGDDGGPAWHDYEIRNGS